MEKCAGSIEFSPALNMLGYAYIETWHPDREKRSP